MLPFIGPILNVINTAGGIFGKWQERKTIKAQGKVDIEKAVVAGKIKQVQSMTDSEAKYDIVAAEGMKHSWKDEWFTVLLSIPVIMCFIPYPPLQDQVRVGFLILKEHTPEWYQYCFIGAIVASFGLKTWMGSKMK